MALNPTYTLTVDLVAISGGDVAGIPVEIEMADPRLISLGAPPNQETLFPTQLASATDASGVVRFTLLPSSLVGNYKVSIGGLGRVIAMPEADARLSELADAE